METSLPEKINKVTKQDIDSWLFGSNTKLTEAQKQLFYQVSLSFNLNPAKREVYAIPFGNNFNIITGFEVYLKRAERTGLLEWWETGVKKDNNEYIGFCTIKRKDREKPTTIEAWFNEYNQNNNMWKTKPRTMIRKVAIAQAFRMVFPDELGGLPYTADELDTGNGNIVDVQPQQQIEASRIEKMIYHLNAAGKLGNAEKFVGKKSSEWTDEDINKIEAAKKKPLKAPESPTSPQTQETNDNGRGITDEQIDRIESLCQAKGVKPEAALPDHINSLIELTSVQAEAVIESLAGL